MMRIIMSVGLNLPFCAAFKSDEGYDSHNGV